MNKPDYDWWIAHAHSDSAFLLLMESPDTFSQAVTTRLESVGRPHEQGVINQAMWRAVHEQDRYGSMTSILGEITALPTFGDQGPLGDRWARPFNGPLVLNGKGIQDESGPVPLIGVSCFWAAQSVGHDISVLDRFAEWAVGCGFTYCRWFGAYDWSHGGLDPQRANYFSLMEQTIMALASRGLRSDITFFTRRHQISDPPWFVKSWADLINRHRNEVCLAEICNEAVHPHNGWEVSEVRELAEVFSARCSAPLAISAPVSPDWEGVEDQLDDLYPGSSATATTIHFPRKHDTEEGAWRICRQPWRVRHGVGACPTMIVNNEPERFDNIDRQVPVGAASIIMSLICGTGMVCHHDVYGVQEASEGGEYATDPANRDLQRVLASALPLLPADLPNWTSVRVGQSDRHHPFPGLLDQHWTDHDGPSTGVSRAYAATHNREYVMVLSGVRGSVELKLSTVSSFAELFKIVSLRTGEHIYEGAGPLTLHEQAGEAFLVVSV